MRTAGARLVEVGDEQTCTEQEVKGAIGPRTAALISIVSPRRGEHGVPVDRMAAIAHAHGRPLIVEDHHPFTELELRARSARRASRRSRPRRSHLR